jgi:hypothetical protein
LLALKEVIRAKELGRSHAPYRQSRLTQVLEESLTGARCKTTVVGCVSPSTQDLNSTINTLRYAESLRPPKKAAKAQAEADAKASAALAAAAAAKAAKALPLSSSTRPGGRLSPAPRRASSSGGHDHGSATPSPTPSRSPSRSPSPAPPPGAAHKRAVSPAPAAKEKPHVARPVASRRAPVAPPPLPPRRPSEDLLGDGDEEELDPHALSPKRADALRARDAAPGRSEGRDATMQRARAEAAEARAARAEQQIAERQGLPPSPRRGIRQNTQFSSSTTTTTKSS